MIVSRHDAISIPVCARQMVLYTAVNIGSAIFDALGAWQKQEYLLRKADLGRLLYM